jgi:hypothetical protein
MGKKAKKIHTNSNTGRSQDMGRAHDMGPPQGGALQPGAGLVVVGIVSLVLLGFQVALTRVFSALFAYHYAFLVISIAITGTIIGAVMAHRLRNQRRGFGGNRDIAFLLLTMGASLLAALVLIFAIPATVPLMIYVIFIIPVFICGGMLTATVFDVQGSASPKLYFADLLGAAFGAFIAILFLNALGVIGTILGMAGLCLTTALMLRFSKGFYLISPAAIAFFLLIIFGNNYLQALANDFQAFRNSSEGKSIRRFQTLELESKVVYTKWNAFSRTDVIEVESFDDYKIVTIDGTGNSQMLRFNGDLDSVASKRTESPYFAYSMGKSEKVVLIGSGGGGEIIYPMLAGCRDISAVEINTGTIEAVKYFGEYNGHIYTRPEVKVFPTDGRYFISRGKAKYDVIFMSLVITEIATQSGYMLSEDFVYTTEAFEEYFRHLTPDGRIAIVAHEQPELERLLVTIIQVLRGQGLSREEIGKRMAVLNYTYLPKNYPADPNGVFQPLIIVKNSPITLPEATVIHERYKSQENAILYLPYLAEKGLLGELKSNEDAVDKYMRVSKYSIEPVSDDRPYFRLFTKGLPSDLMVLLLVITLVFLFILGRFGVFRIGGKVSGYFTLLGLGFMLFEVPLISKLTLYLGHPMYGFTGGIFLLLISAGVGSLISRKLTVTKNQQYFRPILAIVLLGAALNLIFPVVIAGTMSTAIVLKALIAVAFIAPLGIFLGMPFPFGLRQGKSIRKDFSIPAVWAVNGLASALGSILAVLVSILVGYSGALWLGITLYAVLLISFNPNTFFKGN